MKFMKYVLAAGVCCILSFGAVTASSHMFGTPTVEVITDGVLATSAQGVDQALQQVTFPVKQPDVLPFDVGSTSAFVRHLPAGTQAVEITYTSAGTPGVTNDQPTYISVTTMNKPNIVQDQSQYPIKTVALASGTRANYIDNGTTQILSWSDADQSYAIFGGKPNSNFTTAELAQIANQLK